MDALIAAQTKEFRLGVPSKEAGAAQHFCRRASRPWRVAPAPQHQARVGRAVTEADGNLTQMLCRQYVVKRRPGLRRLADVATSVPLPNWDEVQGGLVRWA